MPRISRALLSASACCARAVLSWVLTSPNCCAERLVLFSPTNRLVLERNSSTRDSASATFLRRLSISTDSHCPAGTRLIQTRGLLQFEIAFGDRIGDARREFAIGRLKFDGDDARLVDGIGRQALEIGIHHALLGAGAERIAAHPEQRQHGAQRREAAQHGIEFRQRRQAVLGDDIAREIARQNELHLAGDRFGIERAACIPALGIRTQEDVVATVDENAGFALVAGRHHVDGDEGQQCRDHRRQDDPDALAPQRTADGAHVDVAGCGSHRRRAPFDKDRFIPRCGRHRLGNRRPWRASFGARENIDAIRFETAMTSRNKNRAARGAITND